VSSPNTPGLRNAQAAALDDLWQSIVRASVAPNSADRRSLLRSRPPDSNELDDVVHIARSRMVYA